MKHRRVTFSDRHEADASGRADGVHIVGDSRDSLYGWRVARSSKVGCGAARQSDAGDAVAHASMEVTGQ